MATGFNVAGLSAYVDQSSKEILSRLTIGAKSKKLARVITGLKGTTEIHTGSQSVTYQAGACKMTANGQTTLGKKNITVTDIGILEEYCNKDLLGKWTELVLKAGATAELGENELYQFITTELEKGIAAQEEINIWQGDTTGSGNTDFYDGWIKIIAAGSAVNGNISAATEITEANIFGLMQDIYKSMLPLQIVSKPDAFIAMGEDTFGLLQMALVNANLYHYGSTGENMEMKLPGTNVTVYGLGGLNATNKMYASYWSNMIVGSDLTSDEEMVSVYADPRPSNSVIEVSARFKAGAQVGFVEEVVEFVLV